MKKNFLLCTHGTFHYFNLAKALLKKKQLVKIISGYPYFKLTKYNIPKSYIEATGFYQSLNFIFRKLGFQNNNFILNFLNWNSSLKVDKKSSKFINHSDVFLSLSGGGLNTGRQFIKNKKIYICERASSHILYARKILKKEYAKYHIKFDIDQKFIDREIAEYKSASKILVPSRFVQKTFENHGLFNTTVLTYPSDHSVFFKIKNIFEKKFQSKNFKILFVGGLTLRKGVPYLLKAFNQLPFINKELHLIGSVSKEYKLFKNLINRQNTFVYGHLDQKKINYLMNQSHLFVMPSIEEGAAISVAQAMNTGLPVIVSENTGWKDTVQKNENGFVVPIMNSKKIYEKILYLKKNQKLLKKYSLNSLKYSKNKTWDQYVDQLNKLIASL